MYYLPSINHYRGLFRGVHVPLFPFKFLLAPQLPSENPLVPRSFAGIFFRLIPDPQIRPEVPVFLFNFGHAVPSSLEPLNDPHYINDVELL